MIRKALPPSVICPFCGRAGLVLVLSTTPTTGGDNWNLRCGHCEYQWSEAVQWQITYTWFDTSTHGRYSPRAQTGGRR